MSSIPSNLTRVPNSLASGILLGGITNANADLLRVQTQLATMQRVNRPSDDPVAAALLNTLDRDLEAAGQLGRNLNTATSMLGVIDQRIGGLNELALEAKTIASSQVGIGSDSATRAQQAVVVDSLISELLSVMNSDYAGVSLFAGTSTGGAAVEAFDAGYRYAGSRGGLSLDLGDDIDFPVTLAADEVAGSFSGRVEGDVDLNPLLTDTTLLRDLRGPLAGVDSLGTLEIEIDDGALTTVSVDLSGAETIGDVTDMIENAIREQGPGGVLSGGWGAGVTLGGDRLNINVLAGAQVRFNDGPVGSTATSLGLGGFTYASGSASSTLPNTGLDPAVTDRTTLGQMSPGLPLDFAGQVVIRNGSRAGTVTLDPSMTVEAFREAVARLGVGARVEVDPSGDSLNIVNEVAGTRLSVEETGGLAATRLGLRSLRDTTDLSVFNDGRGVSIADGEVDETGAPDPNRNVDFRVTLSDGTSFDVDLEPADVQTVTSLVNRINAQAAAAGVTVGTGPGEFQASLDASVNGIRLADTLGGPGVVSVESLNGFAAEDLGLLDGAQAAGVPATLIGSDRATVRVDSLFTTLIELRDALRSDDERGITLAGGRLEADVERVTVARATVGGRTQRVEASERRLEDRTLLDETTRSLLRDLDYTEAATRFNLLQTQLQASLTTAAQSVPLSLLNFL